MENEKKKTGRKPKSESAKKKQHPVYATDAEWSKIESLASEAELEVSPFIIKKALS